MFTFFACKHVLIMENFFWHSERANNQDFLEVDKG